MGGPGRSHRSLGDPLANATEITAAVGGSVSILIRGRATHRTEHFGIWVAQAPVAPLCIGARSPSLSAHLEHAEIGTFDPRLCLCYYSRAIGPGA